MPRLEPPLPPLAPPPVPQLPEAPQPRAMARLPMPRRLPLGLLRWASSTAWQELGQELLPLLLE